MALRFAGVVRVRPGAGDTPGYLAVLGASAIATAAIADPGLDEPLGPDTDGPAYAAVEDAICQLRQFPRSNHAVARGGAIHSAQQ